MSTKRSLVKAFLRLTARERERLAFHEKARTPICCGDRYLIFTDVDGAG